MAIDPGKLARGCSAYLEQPVSEPSLLEAQKYVNLINEHNDLTVVYRSSDQDRDILDPVFRWTLEPPKEVFDHGFRSDDQGTTSDVIYYNIREYVNNVGQLGMEPHGGKYVFVSTTLSVGWTPQSMDYGGRVVYRYEIYAPGGIMVGESLGNRGRFDNQREIIFVRGIHRQYIRSAQSFRLVPTTTACGEPRLSRERLDTTLLINPYFNPASHPETRLLRIRYPIDSYYEYPERNQAAKLKIEHLLFVDQAQKKQEVSTSNRLTHKDHWYSIEVGDCDTYITAAFRSTYKNEAYLFMGNEYVIVNYDPRSDDDKVLKGPLLICHGFPSLADTPFGENGIDSVLSSRGSNQAYIFSKNLCAFINFVPKRVKDCVIIEGPMLISKMFPFLEGTGFENGVDTAFEYRNSSKYEAYIFKGDHYVLIDYKKRKLISKPKPISCGFYSLKGTIFENGIDASFTSRYSYSEVYVFKGDQYALIDFGLDATSDKIIIGPKPIKDSWPALRPVLPRKNHGLDHHYHVHPHRANVHRK